MNESKLFSFYLAPIVDHPIPEPDPRSLEDIYKYLRYNDKAIKATEALREELRRGGDGREFKKKNLESVTFGGVFDYRNINDKKKLQEKGKKGLLSPSGYVTIDIDYLSLLGAGKLEELREAFLKDKELGLRLLFVSPRGEGLKLVCRTLWDIEDEEDYKSDYYSILGYLHEKYNIPYFVNDDGEYIQILDDAGDITRACYLCHDSGAVLLPDDGGNLFNSDDHYFPEMEVKEDARRERGELVHQPRQRPEILSSPDWRTFVESRLIPSCFNYIDTIFPDMGFSRSGGAWKSPLKLDGTPAKSKRRDKSVITQRRPDRILEQGGGSVGLIDFYMMKNSLSFQEARKELSRICGLEEEEALLRRKTAEATNGAGRGAIREEPTESPTGAEKGDNSALFASLMALPKEGDFWADLAQDPEGFRSRYYFDEDGKSSPLVIPSEGVTYICGLSSHFKSTFLRNLALQMAEDPGEGDILFFSLEDSLRKTKRNLFCALSDAPIEGVRKYAKSRDWDDIYYSGDEASSQADFYQAEENLKKWLSSGRLRILSGPEDSSTLLSFLDYFRRERKIKAVFIDFIQRMKSGRKISERREDMRLIAEDLQNFTKEAKVPVIVAAQLNRQTQAPDRMGSNNIAESADLTRYAEVIVCLWASHKREDVTDDKFLDSEKERALKIKGFELGKKGYIYAKITKDKEGGTRDAVLRVKGSAGKIYPNENSGGIIGL